MTDAPGAAIALRVASIVEGHGKAPSVPILLERIWYEMLNQEAPIDILRPPIRVRRGRLVQNKDNELFRAVGLASAKLNASTPPARDELILILFDADKKCPRDVGPNTTALATTARKDKNIACVVANVEYETWFVAGAESLAEFLDLSRDANPPIDPEAARHGKGWIERRFRGVKYSETVDQPKLTARLDLQLARQRSPSFDKLCREFEQFIAPDKRLKRDANQ